MLTLAWPWLLLLLPLPLVIHRFLPAAGSTRAALKVPFYDTATGLAGPLQRRSAPSRVIVLGLIWTLLLTGAARPQWAGEAVTVPVSGRDLMLAVDVSGSMKARDMVFRDQPQDRLSAVKRVAGEFIEQRQGDRIGLILFGTRAYLQAPLTLDRDTVNTLLQESAIGIAGEKTAIGDAIGLALKRLKDRAGDDKVLVLLTDGSNTAGAMAPLQAAELARTAGLRIHTIGVGAEKMPVRSVLGNRLINPSAELDERTLGQIAKLTGGQYFRARDSQSLAQIYRHIDQLEPVEEDTSHLRPVRELFHLPVAVGALLSLLLAMTIGGLLPGRDRPAETPVDPTQPARP